MLPVFRAHAQTMTLKYWEFKTSSIIVFHHSWYAIVPNLHNLKKIQFWSTSLFWWRCSIVNWTIYENFLGQKFKNKCIELSRILHLVGYRHKLELKFFPCTLQIRWRYCVELLKISTSLMYQHLQYSNSLKDFSLQLLSIHKKRRKC